MNQLSDLIVFSHLRWNFVFQRPQHVHSRLAQSRRVFFIEEPIFEEATKPHWKFSSPSKNVIVCQPHTPVKDWGYAESQIALLQTLVREMVAEHEIDTPAIWFSTPLALPLINGINTGAVVYDCMDELSAFLHAPPQLLQRERELLARADVVFTGGPSLYKAKKDRHPNVHCFSSSVDAAHFAQALDGKAQDAPDQATLPHPRLGFYGVIDERFDIDLIDAVGKAHPEWQICLVGPVVKIDPAALPQRDNIHYFGQRSYAELPNFLAGWNVCLLPFARNESTRFISPTKVIEYMAAEKPIVSTSITDVAEPYGDIVRLGDAAEEFIKACESSLNMSTADKSQRIERMHSVLARTSWDNTAAAMNEQIERAIQKRLAKQAPRTQGEHAPKRTEPTRRLRPTSVFAAS